ncbi:MAG TPA: hypothetical protein VGD08_24005 [Stellaceae bacterium]|jgi:hypothetical protein
MSLIYYLRQEAARCRRLAASVDDVELSHRLYGLAERFENRATALDAPPAGGGVVVPQAAAGDRQGPFDPGSAAADRIGRATAADDILERVRART